MRMRATPASAADGVPASPSWEDELSEPRRDVDAEKGLLLPEPATAQGSQTNATTAVTTKQPLSGKAVALAACILGALALLYFLPQKSGEPSQAHAATDGPPPSLSEVMSKAGRRALGGGLSGAIAGACQVLALMWLRTTMNYQYRHGGGTRATLATLYSQGGVRRFYQGLIYALLQTPLSRFGDTAANTGVLALFAATAAGAAQPIGVRTAFASAAGSLWRIVITPLDTCKTTLQVEGAAAYSLLLRKARRDGYLTLWNGAIGNAVATFVGSYPWFLTFNTLDEVLPPASRCSSQY